MTDFLKKQAADEKGATSVLIIFMIMVLVTLGAFAIVSANANYKLSQRALDWNDTYYDLDAKGEELISILDGKLAEAEMMAYEYVKNKKYSTPGRTDIPNHLQAEIYRKYLAGRLQNDYILDIYIKVYMYYADKNLDDLANENSSVELFANENGSFVNSISVLMNFKSERPVHELCGLNISVLVEPAEYTITEINGNLSVVRANDNFRYKIQDWYEYQEPQYDEEPTDELWNGEL